MIVKIQTAKSSDGNFRALIYNKDRSFQQEFLADTTILAMVGPTNKGYFEVTFEGTELVIETRVDNQPW